MEGRRSPDQHGGIASRRQLPPYRGRYSTRSVRLTRRIDQEKLLDRLPDPHPVIDHEKTGHRLLGADLVVGEIGHGRAVVGQDDALALGCPGEDGGVLRLLQPDVLHAEQGEVGPAQPQATQDVALEVLVGEEAQRPSGAAASREQAAAEIRQRALVLLDGPADRLGSQLALGQVGLHRLPVAQVVRDDRVDVLQAGDR